MLFPDTFNDHQRPEILHAAVRVLEAAGYRVLLPAVRAADPDTLVITSGYSCAEQIHQEAGRRPLHVAEVLALALDGGDEPSNRSKPWKP